MAWTWVLAGVLLAGPVHGASEDADLDRVPPPVEAPPPAGAATAKDVNYMGNDFAFFGQRKNLPVPFPPPDSASWRNWLFLDMRDEWRASPSWRLSYSGRLNFIVSNNIPAVSRGNVRHDLRELFAEWHPVESIWIDVGRINFRNGVALGFNPTDFFRAGSVVDRLTADPSVLREDRLGTAMLSGQFLFSAGSVTLAYAPRVSPPRAIGNGPDNPGFDPGFNSTNAEDRFLAKTTLNISGVFNPEFLFSKVGNRVQAGANVTAPMGRGSVLYLEWAGGMRSGLIAEAFRFGRATGALPASAAALLPAGSGRRFMHDVSAGLSHATSGGLTVNLEYHFHEAGLSAQDWSNWYGGAARAGAVPGVAAALWYPRAYALDRQEPVARHEAFVRAEWRDAFTKDLTLTALTTVDLRDGSGFAQVSAVYRISREWTAGGQFSATFGGRQSDYGSLPGALTGLARLARYF